MPTSRLEAFSDGVLAIIITIMVLELHPPMGSSFADLRSQLPLLGVYALSFTNIGIYWNNHHHLLTVARRTTTAVQWANLHLLFWLSLIPFTTAWVGERHFADDPMVVYGVVLLCAGAAYFGLQYAIVADQGAASLLRASLGRDGKGKLSVAIYLLGVALAFVDRWVGLACYVAVAIMWIVPDRRLERLTETSPAQPDAAPR